MDKELSQSQTQNFEENPTGFFSQLGWSIIVVVVFSVAARLLAATIGHNYDLDSYLIVAKIVDAGGNVYNPGQPFVFWDYLAYLARKHSAPFEKGSL